MSKTHNVGSSKDSPFDPIDWENMVNHPAFVSEIDLNSDLHPATEALQALKFESEDPDANALSYKDEGNYYYKRKEFVKAIKSYTAGLLAKSSDCKLNAMLYTNRALCHFCIQNYRSCIRDCNSAIKFSPDHLKAYVKGIEACLALSRIDEALQLASAGLNILPSSSILLEAQCKILRKQMELDKETEKKSKGDCKEKNEENAAHDIVKSRGINVNHKLEPIDFPETSCSKFHVDSLGKFHWPVLFMYPEFGQTDFLRDVIETSKIVDCLKLVFGGNQPPPPWDPKGLYTVEDNALEVYFEHEKMKKFAICSPEWTIKKLTGRDGFSVRRDLLIVLHVVSKRSEHFYNQWKDELT
uniref:Cns1/TTC4 wheel domain-containing protein n=1 Tax=Trichobilharzia regenti TaxID=157069 RepID=A0AA85JL56_TRIRE|nr:unnamed protein product [Trichobilharzia regenti]